MNNDDSQTPTLLFIIGPPAVGKMTVGQELARLTGFRLFHLHQVVDLLTQYFDFDSPPFKRLATSYRAQLFAEAAHNGRDIVTTGGWDFDDPAYLDIFWNYVRPFVEHGGRVCFVELIAPLETRLQRNQTENRRRHEKTDWSTNEALRGDAALHRYDSGGALPFDLPFLRIETENLSVEATARRIRDHFGLQRLRSDAD